MVWNSLKQIVIKLSFCYYKLKETLMERKEENKTIEDSFGKLAHDFNCKKADDIFYKPFADGVRHFKETKEGREIMCESFERLADKVAEQSAQQSRIDTMVENIKALMESLKLPLEQALNALNIQGKDRAIIVKQLQKSL